MEMWKNCTLADLGDVVGGATPSTKVKENYDGGTIPWITPKDLAGFQGRFISRGERNITEQGLRSCSTQIMPKDTVLFSSRAPIGYVAIAKTELCTNQGFKSIVPNANTDPLFLYYLLVYNKDRIENMGVGTTFKEVSTTIMKGISVRVPKDISYQRYIANTLSMLDERIECNHAINKNLEEQARAIFKNWFIDLTPFSTDGSLPLGWRGGKVDEIVEFHDAKRIPLSNAMRVNMEKIYPYYGATSCMDYVDDYIFEGTYLLFGEDGTVIDKNGFPILQYVDGKFWVNNHAHILTGKTGFSVEWLYLMFSMTKVDSIVTGAVQPKISQSNLKKIALIIPPLDVLSSFDRIIQPMFVKLRNNRLENMRLAELRDFLLPRLMSGEIDVSDIAL